MGGKTSGSWKRGKRVRKLSGAHRIVPEDGNILAHSGDREDELKDREMLVNGLLIPTGVKDKLKYVEWYTLHEEFLNSEDKYYTTSKGDKIDVQSVWPHIEKKLVGLTQAEKDKVRRKVKAFNRMKGHMLTVKKQAYGILHWASKDQPSIRESVLEVRKAAIIEYYGRFYSDVEVHKIATQKWGYDITVQSLITFRKKYMEEIQQRQQAFTKEFSDIRLGYKRGRLEELAYLFRTQKDEYEAKGHPLSISKEMRGILKDVYEEVEGHKLVIDASVDFKVTQQLEMHIHSQLMSEVSIKELIIARVASRLNVSPLKLMERMMTSYYSQYTGFATPERSIDEMDRIYPSSLIYNFDDMTKMDSDRLLADKNKVEIVDAELVSDEETVNELKKIKSDMIHKILERKLTINKATE